MGTKASPSKNHTIELNNQKFTLRTKDPSRLNFAAKHVNQQIEALSAKHPLMRPNEIYLLALLEMAFEQTELFENGKDLLKQTDNLIEWMDNQIG
jgi:cell division protein ZapA (FtsZ GTPase activity inhibitor)